MRRNIVLLTFSLLLGVLLAGVSAAQEPSSPAPGGIKLLPGYTHVQEQGSEAGVGLIVKGDRAVIRYDIDPLAGLRVDPKERDRCSVYQEQHVEDQTMRLCVSGNAFTLVFVEAGANFYGEARDQKELFSLVSMLKTFRGPHDIQLGR